MWHQQTDRRNENRQGASRRFGTCNGTVLDLLAVEDGHASRSPNANTDSEAGAQRDLGINPRRLSSLLFRWRSG